MGGDTQCPFLSKSLRVGVFPLYWLHIFSPLVDLFKDGIYFQSLLTFLPIENILRFLLTSLQIKYIFDPYLPLYRSKIFSILIEVFTDQIYFHSILLPVPQHSGHSRSANRRQLVLVVLPSAKDASKAHRNHYQLSVPSQHLRIGLYT